MHETAFTLGQVYRVDSPFSVYASLSVHTQQSCNNHNIPNGEQLPRNSQTVNHAFHFWEIKHFTQ